MGQTDSVGPVAGWRGHVQVDAQGVQSTVPIVRPRDEGVWNPQWFSAPAATTQSTLFLQRRLLLAGAAEIKSAVVRITGDRALRLWVNGDLVLRGPDDPGSDVGEEGKWTHHWLYNTIDVAPYLKAGTNTLAIEVVNASLLSAFSTGNTGVAFRLALTDAEGHERTIEGPDGWKGVAHRAYTEQSWAAGSSKDELAYDARLEPNGWPQAEDVHDWLDAVAVPSRGVLQASRIPARMEAVWPAISVDHVRGQVTTSGTLGQVDEDLTVVGDASFTLHFGRVISAYLALEAESDDGATVTLLPKEIADQDGVARPLQITLRNGVTRWESPNYDAFSQVEVRVRAGRHPVRLRFVRAIFTSQPVAYGVFSRAVTIT
jgi:Alpha-L-rhamnosidase N-terminal domain.